MRQLLADLNTRLEGQKTGQKKKTTITASRPPEAKPWLCWAGVQQYNTHSSPTLPGDDGISGWLSPPHRISRDQVGSTCPRARWQQRELLLQRERRVQLAHMMYLIHESVGV